MKKILILVMLMVCMQGMQANNIDITAPTLEGRNTTAGVNNAANYNLINVNVNWENGWRTAAAPANYDAAWVFFKFRVGLGDPVLKNVSSSGTTLTVSSTQDLRPGMPVSKISGGGVFAPNTTIVSITNSTQFVVSTAPSTALSAASVKCFRVWEHAYLNNTGHTAAVGSTISNGLLTTTSAFNATTNPVVGVYMYRSADGTGSVNFINNKFRWNYGAQGVRDSAIVSVMAFAIEMVYVPGGVSFNIGGGGGTNAFTSTTITTADASAAGGFPSSGIPALNANYPNGYNALYCMKYQITQGQYRDFLNTLTREQQISRFMGTNIANFMYIKGRPTSTDVYEYYCDFNNNDIPNESSDGEWYPCNYIGWPDGLAFADWAGLRPMTEFEYEKICRGPTAPVANEYPWGSTSLTPTNGVTGSGASETSTNVTANANIGGNYNGITRVGIFARATSTRVISGATYYGVMDMGSNLCQTFYRAQATAGSSYNGLNGNGILSQDGFANTSNWPGPTLFNQTILRGGTYTTNIGSITPTVLSTVNARTSDRSANASVLLARNSIMGFRLVRSQ